MSLLFPAFAPERLQKRGGFTPAAGSAERCGVLALEWLSQGDASGACDYSGIPPMRSASSNFL